LTPIEVSPDEALTTVPPDFPVEGSMQSKPFLTAALLTASLATSFATTADAAIVVNIDKTTQQMSVSVDGTARYVWPVSTGRSGYDTPNGIFKANRMDADHLSQEWDNAPMPHTIFFDVRGHAVHGFFDVKHLGLPVSHGCVRLSPAHAAALFDLVKAEGMNQTTIVVSGHTPAGSLELVSRRAPVEQASTQPLESASGYGARSLGSYDTQAYYRQQQMIYYPPHPTLVDQLLRLFSPN
jgi:hypothetical protein